MISLIGGVHDGNDDNDDDDDLLPHFYGWTFLNKMGTAGNY